MKLHKIELENLTSLYGKHQVDLDNDLKEAPIFLIIGPTGSGKTTLLDAVALAFFGQTPRLSKQAGHIETDISHIMSHGTTHCSASVEFSRQEANGERTRYRALWSCRRARNKIDGKPQPPKRSLEVIGEDGEQLELIVSDHRKKYWGQPFHQVLAGLTVRDFQRTVLLPQGEFAAFLQAEESERADILERLTSTERYKEIGKLAADRLRDTKTTCQKLESKSEGIDLLSPSKLAENQALQSETKENLAKQELELQQLHLHRTHFEHLLALEKQLQDAQTLHTTSLNSLNTHADDFAKLDEHERCKEAGTLWREQQTLEIEREQHQATLEKLTLEIGEVRVALDTAAKQFLNATETQNKATQNLEDARPQIEAARAARKTLITVQTEAQRALNKVQDAQLLIRNTHREEQAALTSSNTEKNLLSNCETYLNADPQGASLSTEMTGLQAHFAALQQTQTLQKRTLKRLNFAQNNTQTLKKYLLRFKKELAEKEALFQALEEQRTTATKHLEWVLDGAPSPQERRALLKREETRAQEKLQALKSALRLIKNEADLRQQQVVQTTKLAHVETLLQKETVRCDEIVNELKEARAKENVCNQTLQDALRPLNFKDARASLAEHDPCPLCGSHEHPYVHGEDAQKLEAARRQKIQILKMRYKGASVAVGTREKAHLNLVAAIATGKAEQKSLNEHLKTFNAALDALQKEKQTLLTHLIEGFPASSSVATTTQHRTQTHLNELLKSEEALNKAENSLLKLQKPEENARKSIETYRVQIATDTVKAKTEEETSLRLQAEQEEHSKRFETNANKLLKTLDDHRVDVPEGAETNLNALSIALGNAEKRAHKFTEKSKEAETRRAKVNALELKHRELSTRLQSSNEAMLHLAEEQKLRQTTLEEATAKTLSFFEGRDPDSVEKEKTLSCKASATALKTAQEQQDQLKQKLSSQLAREDEQLKRKLVLNTRNQTQTDALQVHIQTLELTNLSELVERILDENLHQELLKIRKSLQSTYEQATGAVKHLEGLLHELKSARPDTLPIHTDGIAVALDMLLTVIANTKETQANAQKQLGVLQERLKRHEDLSRRHADLCEQLQVAREDKELWHEMNDLIGKKDGQAFRDFAQILNLEFLILRANERLKQLAPRYLLSIARDKDGLPTLSFAIRDRYQANTERPITTLSGGETFLVSLSLALALADCTNVEMPIETLLLDEGFGTLDPDSLNIVMEALERLQGRGTQVGIISHVEALRSRIEARIVIERFGLGRSQLRVELGQEDTKLLQPAIKEGDFEMEEGHNIIDNTPF